MRLHRTIAAVHCAYSNRFWILCAHGSRKRDQQTQKQHKREDHSITHHRFRSTEHTSLSHDVEILFHKSNYPRCIFQLIYEHVPNDHCLIYRKNDEMETDFWSLSVFSISKLVFLSVDQLIDLFWSFADLLGNIFFSSASLYPVNGVPWLFRTLFCDVYKNRFGTRTRSPEKWN